MVVYGATNMFLGNAPFVSFLIARARPRKQIQFICDGSPALIRGYLSTPIGIQAGGTYTPIAPNQIITIDDAGLASQAWWLGNAFDPAGTCELGVIEVYAFKSGDPEPTEVIIKKQPIGVDVLAPIKKLLKGK